MKMLLDETFSGRSSQYDDGQTPCAPCRKSFLLNHCHVVPTGILVVHRERWEASPPNSIQIVVVWRRVRDGGVVRLSMDIAVAQLFLDLF